MSETLGCPRGLSCPVPTSVGPDPRAFVHGRGDKQRLELSVNGARCAGCISKIESALLDLPGVNSARLNLSTNRLRVEWAGALDPREVTGTVVALGYGATPFDPEGQELAQDRYGRKLLMSMAIAGFAMANIMLLSVSVWASTNGEMGEGTRSLLHLVSALIAIPAGCVEKWARQYGCAHLSGCPTGGGHVYRGVAFRRQACLF